MTGLIYNQHDIPKDVYRYGLRPSAQTGCGWIATYNALKLLGCTTDIPELIRYFTWQLPVIHGNLGTAFWAPRQCFRKWGFDTELIFDRRRFDEKAAEADAGIVFYHWAGKRGTGAHIVALQKRRRASPAITPSEIPPAQIFGAPAWTVFCGSTGILAACCCVFAKNRRSL